MKARGRLHMKTRTYELKRTKILGWSFTIPMLIIASPFLLLWKAGKVGENVSEFLSELRDNCVYSIADKFKFDDIANEQYKTNPDKFKKDWRK